MNEETECEEGEEAAKRFTRFVKKAVSVPKSEVDRRAKEWREAREAETSETADE